MKLHNRQIKASFWNDPDLLQIQREQRWFYEGLTQLADDSGCLEDSLFAFKLNLYPSPLDSDITIEILAQWRDELIKLKKIIPYEVCGKKCLFLINFHKHQSLKSPEKPEVPLPKWITWKTYKSNDRAGKYVIDYDILNSFLQSSYSFLTPFLEREVEVESELESESESELEKKGEGGIKESDEEQKNPPPPAPLKIIPLSLTIPRMIEKEFARNLSPLELELITKWQDKHTDDIITEAVKRAIIQGKRNFKYIDTILYDWEQQGLKTIHEILEYEEQFASKKRKVVGWNPRGEPPQPNEEDIQSAVKFITIQLNQFRLDNPDHTDSDLKQFLNSPLFNYQPEVKVKAFERLELAKYLERGP